MKPVQAMVKQFVSIVVVLFAVLAFSVQEASAQVPEKGGSSWGITVDATPHWEVMPFLEKYVDDDLDFSGRDLRVGIVRGRTLGGDWGVSFIRTNIDNGSSITSNDTSSYCANNCVEIGMVGDSYHFVDASFTGVEVHKYFPFVTIKDRVQVGMNLGAGALWIRGTADKSSVRPQVTFDNGDIDAQAITEISRIPARDVFEDYLGTAILPIVRLEAVLGLVLTENFKVKVGTGLNLPFQHRVTVGAVWLF